MHASNIRVGQARESSVTAVKNLGSCFDANMNMSVHINKCCQSVMYHLCNIQRIRKYLSFDHRKSIVQSVIMS